jgi:hypothetical protein
MDRDRVILAAVIFAFITSSVAFGAALKKRGFTLLRVVGLVISLAIAIFAILLFMAGLTGEL